MFKSGTSLLRAMLGQHSSMSAGLETAWFELDWQNNLGRGGEALEDYVTRTAEFYGEDRDVAQAMAADSPDALAFIDRLLGAKARRDGSRRWVEKTPGNVRFADQIFARWPDARMVHIIRDPRDTFASLRQISKWDTVEEFASRWCDTFGAWEKFKTDDVVISTNALEIRYESLATDSAATMAQILDFLDEPWEAAAGEHRGETKDYLRVLKATGKASSTLARLAEPMSVSRIGIWQDTLTSNDLAGAEQYVADRDLTDVYRQCFAEAGS
ncbi:MAG: sulfotransferase [Alphaproteobacteria bacterium]|nr:sulfotransferase [Alphaproteobacteria bacterium]